MGRRSGGTRPFSAWAWLALLPLLAGGSTARLEAGGLPSTAVRASEEASLDRSGFRFTFETPQISVSDTTDGYARVGIDGFAVQERRRGAPDIPGTTLWVAIPPDAMPVLETRILAEEVRRGIRPIPVPHESVTSTPEAEEIGGLGEEKERPQVRRSYQEDAALYSDAEGTQPVATLGELGVFRDQRYVEVHLHPVRYDAASRGLRIAKSIDVTVRFEGTGEKGSPARLDPRFEDAYRAAFVNYAQGTTFRVSASPRKAASSAPTRSAAADTAGPRYRIRVRANGVVRLDYALLSQTLFLPEHLSSLKLTSRGVEVPLEIHDAGTADFLDPGDWIQFYGQALDDEPKTALNTDLPSEPDIYEARDFTDENIYFLTVESGARARVATRASTSNTATAPTDFEAVQHFESDDASAWRPLGAADPWYDGPALSNPPAQSLVSQRTDTIALPGLASGFGPVDVKVQLRGLTEVDGPDPDHHSSVTLLNASNQNLGSISDDGSFDGRILYTHHFTWSWSGFTLVTSPVKVQIDALPAGPTNQFILDWIELRYRRTFQASQDSLTFEWPNGDARFDVSSLLTTNPTIYEITGKIPGTSLVQPVSVTGAIVTGPAGNVAATFRVDDDPQLTPGDNRRFVVAGDQGVLVLQSGSDFQQDTMSDLKRTDLQADLIVIGHPNVTSLAPGSALSELLARRFAEGITSKVAMIEDVQDEFNDGLPGPVAIRNFLRWVMSTADGEGWTDPKPAYVLLLGDGSYDYKGGTATGNFVPTQVLFKDSPEWGYFGSDGLLAAVVGNDLVPDLSVGRLPARTLLGAEAMIQKILDYEDVTAWSSWRGNLLFVTDRGKNCNSTEAEDFESLNDGAQTHFAQPPYTTQELYYWRDYCNGSLPPQPTFCPATDPMPYCTVSEREALRADIKNAVNTPTGGAAIVQYAGHGNTVVWSDDAFWDERGSIRPKDSLDLTNGIRLPWLLAHNCLTGGFLTPDPNSLGENWLGRAGGGAIAVFSPSGLSFNSVGQVAIDAVYDDLFGPTKQRRIGKPVLRAEVSLFQNGAYESGQSYVLLADPTLHLTLPDVAPPTGLQATAGNGHVALSWTASTTSPVTYDLYRATSASGPYGNPLTSIGATSFDDTTVQNATTYYYYAVARDARNFASRLSNFNSDCAVNGADCVKATPMNSTPPLAPTGLTVTDPERGGMLRLTWNVNPEGDIKSYSLDFGVDPANPGDPCPFDRTVTVGKVTSYTLTGLTDNVRYCLALTATNTSMLTSSHSAEALGTPTHVLGEKAPGFISDLHLAKSGSDAVLTWGAVTTDIYGKPETLGLYEVYRGATPTFVPSLANRIGTTPIPTFTDPGALVASTPVYHYLVRAIDASGNAGGLGNQLPAGIRTLVLSKGTPPIVTLSWAAVTQTFDGKPLQVDHYAVYGGSQPVTRARIRDGLTTLLSTVTGTSADVSPPLGVQYYSVLAVDARGNQSPF